MMRKIPLSTPRGGRRSSHFGGSRTSGQTPSASSTVSKSPGRVPGRRGAALARPTGRDRLRPRAGAPPDRNARPPAVDGTPPPTPAPDVATRPRRPQRGGGPPLGRLTHPMSGSVSGRAGPRPRESRTRHPFDELRKGRRRRRTNGNGKRRRAAEQRGRRRQTASAAAASAPRSGPSSSWCGTKNAAAQFPAGLRQQKRRARTTPLRRGMRFAGSTTKPGDREDCTCPTY